MYLNGKYFHVISTYYIFLKNIFNCIICYDKFHWQVATNITTIVMSDRIVLSGFGEQGLNLMLNKPKNKQKERLCYWNPISEVKPEIVQLDVMADKHKSLRGLN